MMKLDSYLEGHENRRRTFNLSNCLRHSSAGRYGWGFEERGYLTWLLYALYNTLNGVNQNMAPSDGPKDHIWWHLIPIAQ